MIRFLTKPAAFLATNWAAMLGILTVVGIVPALAGATRTTAHLEEYEDAAFTTTLRHMRRTVMRDAPASVLLLLVVAGIAGNAMLLPQLSSEARVLMVGVLVPLVWVMTSLLSAYVVVAAHDQESDRATIMLRALRLCTQRPWAALLAPGLILVLSPTWLLAPITIACGFSIPPWVVARLWGDPTDDGV